MIDLKIIQAIKKIEESSNYMFSARAENNNYFGRLWISRLRIDMNISDDEYILIKKFLLFKDLGNRNYVGFLSYHRYLQVNHHELCHLFQILTTKYLQNTSSILYTKDKADAVVFLKYIDEYQKQFNLVEHESIQDVLSDQKFISTCFTKKNIDSLNDANSDFLNLYTESNKKTLSSYEIYEGMAHYFSMSITDYLNEDFSKLPLVYNNAYNQFINISCLDKYFEHKRTINLLFLYICYFSLQSIDEEEVVYIFFRLSKKAHFYYNELSNLSKKYTDYGTSNFDNKLKKLEIYEYFHHVKNEKLVDIFAFIDLIQLIANDTKIKYNNLEKNPMIEEVLELFNKYVPFIKNHLALLVLTISPLSFKKFIDAKESIDDLEYDLGDSKISKEIDDQFFEFFLDIRTIFTRGKNVKCCKKHGFVSDRKDILKCKNEDSIISLLCAYLKKEPHEMITLGY